MYIKKIKKIIIFGGGSSGWLTAAYLSTNLKIKTEIVLIESKDHKPIGVGEGTQPYTSAFLAACGIEHKDWMKPIQASFKYGVELIGWTEKPYFIDNDHFINHAVTEKLFVHDYFIDKDPQEYFDWLPAYQLAKDNVSPKISGYDVNTGPGLLTFGAVHFSANDIIETLKNKIQHNITYIQTAIADITSDNTGITALIDSDGKEYTADLFLDCSGFSSILLEKTLGVKFLSYENTLPCNRAVAIPKAYTNPEKECHPYTKSTTMSAGWRWTIPNYSRIGNGYVYCDKFISPEDAEKELRTAINEWEAPANHLTMKCGRLKTIAEKNTCAIGLSAGFVEPLEATGITFTTKVVEWLTSALNENLNLWNEESRNFLNYMFDSMSIEIHAFIWAHYHFATRNDTDFWKQFKHRNISDVPNSINQIMENFIPVPKSGFFLKPTSMFHQGHWFGVLHAANMYKNNKSLVTEDETKYLEYFINTIYHRVNLAKKTFPNHYSFLKDWYND